MRGKKKDLAKERGKTGKGRGKVVDERFG